MAQYIVYSRGNRQYIALVGVSSIVVAEGARICFRRVIRSIPTRILEIFSGDAS